MIDRLLGRTEPEPYVAPAREWPEAPVLDPLPMVVLPPFQPRSKCPKCRYSEVKTDYQRGFHNWRDDCPIPVVTIPDFSGLWSLSWDMKVQVVANLAENTRRRASVPEHQDRTCLRCSYRWAEAVVSE